MSQKLSLRQTRLRNQLPMIGNSVDETGDSVLSKIDAQLAKLFEDRNALLTDGGIITFTGTSVQFTEALKLSLNSKIDGSVQVIDLGSTTRNLSASGRMIYAVIDRTAGTATITDDATDLPEVTSADQEVFLIAKRVDATDGTQRIYFRNGSALNAGQSVRLGAAGSGNGGSGTGDDLNALTFKASFIDLFDDIPTSATSAVDTGAGKTDPTLYSAVNALFKLNYDASNTVTGTGISMTLSGTPSFTVKEGDILVVGLEARRITTVTTQTSYTIESAFSSDPSGAQATVSQAVYSKDLNNFAGDGLAISTAFSSAINQIMAIYEDTSVDGDKIFDANTAPVIGLSASSDGSAFSGVITRPTNLSESIPLIDLPSAGTNLFLRFFANKTSGSGTVNVLGYKVFLHRDNFAQDGSQIAQSYGLTNGAGTEINIVSIGVVGGKTRVKKTWSYPVGVNAGTTNGSLKVYLNGQKIPRFVDSTVTPDASYREIDQNTIELDRDYSTTPLSIEIIQDVAVVDASDTNTTNIAQSQEIQSEAFQAFVKTSTKMNATSTTGTPAAGTFYSSIQNRAPIVDLTQDLKARMGIDRMMVQQISPVPEELGPNNEPVLRAVNDSLGLIRFVGSAWSSNIGIFGPRQVTNAIGDYVEVTFYGTGLNVLADYNVAGIDWRVSVDGGVEGANIAFTMSNVLNGRNYASNHVSNICSGLPLGVHTARLRLAAGSFMVLYGFEILNQSSMIAVQPGVTYLGGKKITSSAQQLLAFNSSFESGTLGTKGGRVVVYQKADGTIAKAVQPTDAAQLNLTSANHQNEEVSRVFHWREFGSGRADDFSSLTTTAGSRVFTLDDGTTTLTGQNVRTDSAGNGNILWTNANGDFYTVTFVGTGLDIMRQDFGAVAATETFSVIVDGTNIGNLSTTYGTRRERIVSGLPYGTHTVKFTKTAGGAGLGVVQFVVYQPKKPVVPTGAVEIADYNIMGNYSATTSSAIGNMSSGVLRKVGVREVNYTGTWSSPVINAAGNESGYNINTTTLNSTARYTFFGTGIEWRSETGAVAYNSTITITDVNTNTTLNLSLYTTALRQTAAGLSFNAGTGVLSGTGVAGHIRLQISGLPLGLYTIRINQNQSGTGQIYVDCFDILTPIHSAKGDIQYDQQNTMLIGSNSISDNRNVTPIKDVNLQVKNVSQAIGISSAPTTTSTVYVPVPDLSVTHLNRTGKIKVSFSLSIINNGAGNGTFARIYVNGQPASQEVSVSNGSNFGSCAALSTQINVPIGVNKIDVYWFVGGGTSTAESTRRTLLVEEA